MFNFAAQSTFHMEKEHDYFRDIAEIRSMMERSSKFLSLSGWAGIMAGIYALAGVYSAWKLLGFNPGSISYIVNSPGSLILVAVAVLVFALVTAIIDSKRKAGKRGEKAWNAVSRRLIAGMSVPLIAGGFLSLVLLVKGLAGLIPPVTLVFYGLALYHAGRYTFREIRILGFIEIALGLTSSYFTEFALLFWAAGFGLVHIIYGIYMFYRYER